MKVISLILLLCVNTLAFTNPNSKKNTQAKLVSPETRVPDAKQPWQQKKTELTTRLQQALNDAKKSNDDQLKQKARTLSGEVTDLINEIKAAKDGQGYEERVSRLIAQLKPADRQQTSSSRTDLDVQKDDLAKRLNDVVGQAQATAKITGDNELKLRAGRLEIEATKLRLSLETITSGTLDVAKKETAQLEAESNDLVEAASSWGISTGLLVGGAGAFLALLTMLLLTISFFHFRSQLSEVKQRDEEYKSGLQRLDSNVVTLAESIKTIDRNNRTVQNDLTGQIASAKKLSEEAKQLASHPKLDPKSTEDPPEPSSPVNNGPTFPSLVSDYLSRVSVSRQRGVEHDFRTETFVSTSVENPPFVVVTNNADEHGILLPRVRLQRGQDYSSHYKSFYDCVDPFAGEIFITDPATVVSSNNGWRLQEKGKMEIH